MFSQLSFLCKQKQSQGHPPDHVPSNKVGQEPLAQLAEHVLRNRMVIGSMPIGGFVGVHACETES